MPSSPSLSLRSLFQRAAALAGLQHDRGVITGLTEGARALYVATRSHDTPDRLIVAVTATDAEADELVTDTRFFLGALAGLDEPAAAAAVLPLPSHEVDPYRGLSPHLHVASARARALTAIATGEARVIVASAPALLPRLVPPSMLASATVELRSGVEIDPQLLAEQLLEAGYTREDPVDEHGEFCIRGGIVDLFPPGDAEPIRVEFIGDTAESMRRYDPSTQRSTGTIDQARIVPIRERLGAAEQPASATLRLDASVLDYFAVRRSAAFVIAEPDEVRAASDRFLEQIEASYQAVTSQSKGPRATAPANVAPPSRLFLTTDAVFERIGSAVRLEQLAIDADSAELKFGPTTVTTESAPADVGPNFSSATPTTHVRCQPVPEFRGRVQDFIAELQRGKDAGEQAVFVATTSGRAERMLELARDYQVIAMAATAAEDTHQAALLVTIGHLARGFRLPEGGLVIYAEADVFEEERRAPEQARRRSATSVFLSDLRDLKVGDYVVHVDHGIGAFVGLKQLAVAPGEPPQEFMELRYAGEDKLFVPVERLDLVQKYTGATKPPVDRLGGTTWEKAKTRVKKAMRDMAEELLKLYAARKAVPGYAFSADSHWQEEFEGAFPYELTLDQSTAIADIKADMESPTPMDRLLCGDVGYGKTEVAMRAAFKAVMDGRQVAVLAPTTVLAFQHLKTLRDRFAGFPVTIDMVSRFRTKQETKAILDDLSAGKVD